MGEACLNSRISTAFVPNLTPARMHRKHDAWYALKVRTGGEFAAVDALRHRGFTSYSPTQKERRRYSDRMKVIETAVFPGYVFCQFDFQEKLPIISCPGVEYIVGFAGVPSPVPEDELLNVSRMIAAGASATHVLTCGQRVRVTHGPLEGIEGVLVRGATGDRLVVSIKLLNQGASLHIDEDEVCPMADE